MNSPIEGVMGVYLYIGHPEPSLFEGVRISSFRFFFIKTLKG
jgi:hypothetical protein